jgi:hypothetical protein
MGARDHILGCQWCGRQLARRRGGKVAQTAETDAEDVGPSNAVKAGNRVLLSTLGNDNVLLAFDR